MIYIGIFLMCFFFFFIRYLMEGQQRKRYQNALFANQTAGDEVAQPLPYRLKKFRLRSFKRQLRYHATVIYRAYLITIKKGLTGQELVGREEWLADNYYIADERIKRLLRAVSNHAMGDIPFVTHGAYRGLPRAYAACMEWVNTSQGSVDQPSMTAFLQQYQQACPFTDDEIWLISTLLEGVLLQHLSAHCRSIQTMPQTDLVPIGNLFNALRSISQLNFDDLFQDISRVEEMLRQDPAQLYATMDDGTKREYRKQVHKLAKAHKIDAVAVVHKGLLQAKTEGQHIGFALFEGPLAQPLKQWERARQIRYAAWSGALTLGIAYAVGSGVKSMLLYLVLLIPASDIALHLVNYCYAKTTALRLIHRVEPTEEVVANNKTLVVISTLLTGKEQASQIVEKLELYYLSNRFSSLSFGVLADYRDGSAQHNKQDAPIFQQAKEGITQLNEKYGNRFFLFQRGRRYNQRDNNYRGWERKRGAIETLVDYLTHKTGKEFEAVVGEENRLHGVRYVITLDGDTRLDIESAGQLIAAMAHPLNQPVVQNGRVVAGYGMLQPRMDININSANKSWFTKLLAGAGGTDAYSGAVSDVYQDVFGQGIYTGKGIFHVPTFAKVLKGCIPENTVLSHDLLEGSYLRCGLISDVTFTDGFPHHYRGFCLRQHRWLRGDWQLVPWLCPWVKNGQGKRVPNPLNLLSRFQMADNMRRSLVPVALLLALTLPSRLGFGRWLTFAAVVLGMSMVTATVDWVQNGQYKTLGEKRPHAVLCGISGTVCQFLFFFATLPHAAWLTVDAAVRSIYRMTVSHQKMLEWVTAADAEKQPERSVWSYYYLMWVQPVCGLLLLTHFGLWQLAAALLWIAAPAICFGLSHPIVERQRPLSEQEQKFLQDTARRTWQYFADFWTREDHYLVPDNYQVSPHNGLAHRTSPTNVGLQLMAALTAADFGWITPKELCSMVDQTVTTLEGLERWNGHFYNWYDTKTLQVLHPQYISTVDSGNLIAFLMTLQQGLLALGEEGAALCARVGDLIAQMRFAPLYDKKSRLFCTGYNVERDEQTHTHYDLLASEARLASYVAVARGEVPKKHWFSLSRTMVSSKGHKGLVSWTGTMFEYFMPLLLLPNIRHTLLDETYQFALWQQMEAGRQARIPWGVSESGYYAFDAELNYQYQAFGTPKLALKRGQERQRVVAPYATMMSLMENRHSGIANLQRIKNLGAYGKYGFYEAIDFTPKRVPAGEPCSIIKSYMVHHLGMSLLSLSNVLKDGILQKRFMENQEIKAAQQLLEERIPTHVLLTRGNKEGLKPLYKGEERAQECCYHREQVQANAPQCHLISGNRYSVMLTDSGMGYSKYKDFFLTRFRGDLHHGIYGNFVYVKNKAQDTWWTNTLAPAFGEGQLYQTTFYSNRVEFVRNGTDGITTTTDVMISPGDDVELRCISFDNQSEQDITLELISYTELLLTSLNNDEAHPAFSNLFVETEFDAQHNMLFAARRPREAGRGVRCGMMTVCPLEGGEIENLSFETDRSLFVGRNQTVCAPNAVTNPIAQQGRSGAVIDPIFSLSLSICVPKGKRASVVFSLAYCESREQAVELAKKYGDAHYVADAIEQATLRGKQEFGFLDMSGHLLKKSCVYLPQFYYITHQRAQLARYIANNRLCQKDLWSEGISGDLPIVTLRMCREGDLEVFDQLATLHHFWQRKGQAVDFVVVCEDEDTYESPLLHAVHERAQRCHFRHCLGSSGGMFVLQPSEQNQSLVQLLYAVSKMVVGAEGEVPSAQLLAAPQQQWHLPTPHKLPKLQLQHFSGYGGFDGKEYVIQLEEGVHTPLPWSNVVSNEQFGFVATESGGGCLWQGNSHENRLTPWSNDAVCDTPFESLYVAEGNCAWTTTPAPLRTKSDWQIRFGFGYCSYHTMCNGVATTHIMFVDQNKPVKYGLVQLENTEQHPKTISLTYYAEPLMGDLARNTKPYLQSAFEDGVLTVRNAYRPTNQDQTLHMAWSEQTQSHTCDKIEFFGDARGNTVPDGIKRGKLSGKTGSGNNTCMALQTTITLQPHEQRQICVALSTQRVPTQVEQCLQSLQQVKAHWEQLITTVQVETPDTAFDQLMNGWLLYQTIVCRIHGRTAFYQSGGAFGFRDQLQDVLAVLHAQPQLARDHIIRCCAHQFVEGDVQHWWHQTSDTEPLQPNVGVRTRFSDDYLWLPYVVAQYVKVTGDREILQQQAPFLTSEPLRKGEDERYFMPEFSGEAGTVYEHCRRSIAYGLKFGSHGLPLIGSGDWNDGMSTVGNKGQGESVWMAWFLYDVLQKFAPLCDEDTAQEYLAHGEQLQQNANDNAWDGEWYRRAYFDDGTPLGSHENDECRIDGISQSWAVISGAGKEEYQQKGMDAALQYLVDEQTGIIQLLTPPFDKGVLEPGYIKGYVPGVRENGGQYTHSAIWLIMACAMIGRTDTAFELFSMINPIHHATTIEQANRYKTEPYVVAADVYSKPPNQGRGGWTWYTGSASWMYQVGLSHLLGLQKEGDTLICNPNLPAKWKEYTIHYRFGSAVYHIHVTQNKGIEVPLVDDGEEHHIAI